ncbi:MAG: hypothetical protein A2Y10_11995 [Planctomycetes bacterium GWF2_41_51]|nr:MAG: hypothetical protein A2Y10_11995 [Planctomycetes bacterium GWF2_41_51]HBG28667.1 hypothetical protein [Phycisphaerales bacterium]
MRKKLRRRQGFTLPEVLTASALLVIAFVPILKALTQINLSTVIIERRTKSLNLAKMKINHLHAKSIKNFDDDFSESNLVLDSFYLCNISNQSVNGNLKSIVVSVGMDRNGNRTLDSSEVEISLQTQLARR